MAQVGSLYTSLTLESSSFISNMKKAADAADRGAGQIDKAFGVLKGAAAGLVAGIGIDAVLGVVNRGLDYASSLGEVSQQLGVTTKDLQVFRYAATQTGIDQETMDKGLGKLTKTLGDAKLGSKSAAEAFGQLGISQAQIAKLDTGEAIRLIAEKLATIEDPAKRAAIETDLFGKAGQKLDTLLAGGRSAVDELARAAEKLGVVLSDENIQKADETADKLSAMNTVLSAKIASTVAENADGILYLADAVFNLTDAMLKGLPAAGRYYAGLAKVYKDDGIFAGLKETFFGTPESNQNTIARGGDGSFRMRGVTGATSFEALNARGAADRPVLGSSKNSVRKKTADAPKPTWLQQVRRGDFDMPDQPFNADLAFTSKLPEAVVNIEAIYAEMGKIQALPPLDIITPDLLERAEDFGNSLAEGLGNAIATGQSLGDVLVNSLRRAGAELITSGLKSLFNGDGESGSGGGIFGGVAKFLGGLFGGKRESGGPVQPGLAYLVGEKGPEMFMPGGAGQIMSADATRKVNGIVESRKNDGQGQQGQLSIKVEPSPLFVTSVVQGAKAAASDTMRRNARPRLPASAGT